MLEAVLHSFSDFLFIVFSVHVVVAWRFSYNCSPIYVLLFLCVQIVAKVEKWGVELKCLCCYSFVYRFATIRILVCPPPPPPQPLIGLLLFPHLIYTCMPQPPHLAGLLVLSQKYICMRGVAKL